MAVVDLMDDVALFLRRHNPRSSVRMVMSNMNETLVLIPPDGDVADIE
jgi:hypothetical protein